jgi:hypothetical protein
MPNRLLEIGAGSRPAIQNPGWLLGAPEVEYFAVDYNGLSRVVEYDKRLDPADAEHTYYGTACRAAMDQLPFRDESFRHVIMKNVIGEYSLGLLKGKDPHTPDNMSNRSYASALQGFHDILRVLEPGGEVVVSEEDTPADCLQLASHVSAAGFTDVAITPYSPEWFSMKFGEFRGPERSFSAYGPRFTHTSLGWLNLRGAYWSTTPKLDKYGCETMLGMVSDVAEDYWRSSYILTAAKPDIRTAINPA